MHPKVNYQIILFLSCNIVKLRVDRQWKAPMFLISTTQTMYFRVTFISLLHGWKYQSLKIN